MNLKHKRSDAPHYLFAALWSALHGRFRFARRCIGLAFAALLLAGCVHPRVVQTSCITPAQLQQLRDSAPPKVREQLTGKADEDLRIIAGSNLRLRGYADGLVTVLESCAQS